MGYFIFPPEVTLTDEIYLASLEPARANLITNQYHVLVDPSALVGPVTYNPVAAAGLLADALATGKSVDMQIMLWGWSATMTMLVRKNDGYAYVPAYGQPNINIAPGLSMPGVPSNYQGVAIPQGSIPVSIDKKDYLPYAAPIIPPSNAPSAVGPFEISAVGPDNLFHYYFGITPGDKSPLGTTTTFNGQKFIKVDLPTEIMGFPGDTMFWQLVQ